MILLQFPPLSIPPRPHRATWQQIGRTGRGPDKIPGMRRVNQWVMRRTLYLSETGKPPDARK